MKPVGAGDIAASAVAVDAGASAAAAGTSQQSVHIEFCTSWGMQRNFMIIKNFLEQEFPEVCISFFSFVWAESVQVDCGLVSGFTCFTSHNLMGFLLSVFGFNVPYISSPTQQLQGHITGGNYPPPPYAVILMQLISIIHLMVLPLVFIGDALWSYLPYFSSRGPPTIYKKAKEYPMQFFTVLFFVIPTVRWESLFCSCWNAFKSCVHHFSCVPACMHSYATPCTSRILSIVQLIQSKVTTGAFEIAVDGQVVFSKLQMGRFPEADDLIKIFSATK